MQLRRRQAARCVKTPPAMFQSSSSQKAGCNCAHRYRIGPRTRFEMFQSSSSQKAGCNDWTPVHHCTEGEFFVVSILIQPEGRMQPSS